MINADGTVNSEQNPARQGSIVTIYATGLNNTLPSLATGAIAAAAAPLVLASQLQLGSSGGVITYAGAAPGFVGGLTQVNFQVPVSIFHGLASVSLYFLGSYGSTPAYFYQQ